MSKYCILNKDVEKGEFKEYNQITSLYFNKKQEYLTVEQKYYKEKDGVLIEKDNIIELAVNNQELIKLRDFLNSLELYEGN